MERKGILSFSKGDVVVVVVSTTPTTTIRRGSITFTNRKQQKQVFTSRCMIMLLINILLFMFNNNNSDNNDNNIIMTTTIPGVVVSAYTTPPLLSGVINKKKKNDTNNNKKNNRNTNFLNNEKKILPKKLEKFTTYTLETIPGAVAPLGIFDPLNLGQQANEDTLKRYREAELTHGRVAMLAVVGFLVGEEVEGSSFLFDASIRGPAISHPFQVPIPFWMTFIYFMAQFEIDRAKNGWVEPEDVPFDQPGLLRKNYIPGDLQFDPCQLKPKDYQDYIIMQTKELQNGRLAMIGAAGFLAQEAVDKKGIFEHWLTQ